MAKKSTWLPGDQNRGKEYYWNSNPHVGSYLKPVRTPWLSLALAIFLLVASVAGIVAGASMVALGQGAGWGLLLPSLLVALPIAIVGTVLAARYYRTARRRGR